MGFTLFLCGIALKVKLVSEALGVDCYYEEPFSDCRLNISMDELFKLAKCYAFDEVAVYLTPHNEAYTRKHKTANERTPVDGWISLKGIANGGGYLNDKMRRFPV